VRSRQLLRDLIVMAVVLGAVGAARAAEPEPAPPADAALSRALTRALEAGALRGARVGALVVDDADGRVVFDRSADQALVPASNLKIVTALAALRVFGPAHAFRRIMPTPRPTRAA
jgi:D-alanyl-D-alanine carboxypeptidase/D-alanyl-D-alanine-endopeptidase (penicillin-binding protein 4)